MQSHKNNVIVASAGGRKTTFVVESALEQKDKRVLITTYTRENLEQINSYITEHYGCVPPNIEVLSWFTFLLRDGVRPYQNHQLEEKRVNSIDFVSTPNRFTPKKEEAFFINRGNNLYRDRVSDFVCQCNKESGGLVIQRLEKIYDHIYIDEMQDMSGWDQDFIGMLMDSSINLMLVGDPRQATYSTTNSQKNKHHKGVHMVSWAESMAKKDKCGLEERTECYRCNQEICDFADNLYPDLAKTVSKNEEKTGHDGVFFIKPEQVHNYFHEYDPTILRWDKGRDTLGLPAINIGVSKGRTFDRVLVFPTDKMKRYFKSKKLKDAGDLSKFYVSITRARYSVAFIVS